MIQFLAYKFVNLQQLIFLEPRNEAEAQGHADYGTEGFMKLDVLLCCLFIFGLGNILQIVRSVTNFVICGPSFGSRI